MDIETWLQIKSASTRILIGCLVMFVCQQICMYSTKRNSGVTGFRILIYPFVFLHELAHYLMAFLMGFSNIKLKMYCDTEGRLGSVSYMYPKSIRGHVGTSITALAPLIFGSWVLYGLCSLIGLEAAFINGFMTMSEFTEVLSAIMSNPVYLTLGIYLLCGVCVAMSPSIQDYKSSISGLFAILTLVMIGLAFGTLVTEHVTKWIANTFTFISNIITMSAGFTVLTMLLVLIVQPVFLIMRRHSGSYK